MTQAIRDHKKLILTLLSGALLLILAVVYIFPFFHMFSTSFKTFAEANMMPPCCRKSPSSRTMPRPGTR